MDEKKTTTQKMQEAYVEARVSGLSPTEAKSIAGYSESTNKTQIERIGGPVHTLMVKALSVAGITEDWVANKYHEAVTKGLEGANNEERDLNSVMQGLKQIGFLMGYAKNNPTVAVQINNGTQGSGVDESAATREDIEYLKGLIEDLAEQVGRDQSSGLLPRNIGATDPGTHQGVGEPASDQTETGGGGQP